MILLSASCSRMGAPADDAAGGEDAGEEVARNAHRVLEAGGIEIDIAVPLISA